MKTFSARPGSSGLLEYCKIRPGIEARFIIRKKFSALAQREVYMRTFNVCVALLCSSAQARCLLGEGSYCALHMSRVNTCHLLVLSRLCVVVFDCFSLNGAWLKINVPVK